MSLSPPATDSRKFPPGWSPIAIKTIITQLKPCSFLQRLPSPSQDQLGSLFFPIHLVKTSLSLPKKGKSGKIKLLIVHIALLPPQSHSAHSAAVRSLWINSLQINEIRISCKCGKRLVRGIPVSGRSKWQDLPVFLTRFCKLIYKSVSFFRKTSDSIVGRDTG